MRYKRQESFRYPFYTPIDCEFKIIKLNEEVVDSRRGKAKIHDLSPNGLKLSTTLDLLNVENKCEIEVYFPLVFDHIVSGEVVWQKYKHEKSEFYYGVQLLIDKDYQNRLVQGLKIYNKRDHVLKNNIKI